MNAFPYLPEHLTSEQREAILHAGSPLLIIAGPGSGKTEVLTRRVAHLARAGLVAPQHLLVTIFTNKAALELKGRIQLKLREELEKERDLIGEDRARILWYTRCAELGAQHGSTR